MRKFHIYAFISSLPLLAIIIAIWLVDPYNLFRNDEKFNEEKFRIGYGFDQGRRYKIFTYLNNPTDKIILGASEINVINEQNIPEKGWHSLSYGGAPLYESLQMYWEISKRHHLSKVIIAPEFIKYCLTISSSYGHDYYSNFNWINSQSAKAFEIYNKKQLYFTDKYSIKATYANLCNYIGMNSNRGVPDMSKSEFWKEQIDYALETYSEDFSLSSKKKDLRRNLEEIKKDAMKKNTELIIVIPVQHIDLLKLEYRNETFQTYQEYIQTLVDVFGKVHYLAYIKGVSDEVNQFFDPFHYQSADLYIDKIYRGDSHLVITKSNVDSLLEIKKEIDNYEKDIIFDSNSNL